jgi:hypothetical protein
MADVIRWIVIAELVILCGWAVAVLREAGQFRSPPKHIYMVATSYIMLAVGWLLELYNNLGSEWAWGILLQLVPGTFGLLAMLEMYTYYKLETREHRHQRKSEELAMRMLEKEGRR